MKALFLFLSVISCAEFIFDVCEKYLDRQAVKDACTLIRSSDKKTAFNVKPSTQEVNEIASYYAHHEYPGTSIDVKFIKKFIKNKLFKK